MNFVETWDILKVTLYIVKIQYLLDDFFPLLPIWFMLIILKKSSVYFNFH